MTEITYDEYMKVMPLAQALYDVMYGKPTTHHQYVNSFNIRGSLIRIIINHKQ